VPDAAAASPEGERGEEERAHEHGAKLRRGHDGVEGRDELHEDADEREEA
jgi:hypothetical protein